MAIIVEDGTIVAGGNAYASLADVDTFHEERLNTLWTAADDEKKEAAMLRATAGIESKYRERWFGVKTNNSVTVIPQFLAWPRRKLKSETPIDPDTLAQVERELEQTKRMLNKVEKNLKRTDRKRRDSIANAAKWQKRFEELRDASGSVAATTTTPGTPPAGLASPSTDPNPGPVSSADE